jgi:hypothetical protein
MSLRCALVERLGVRTDFLPFKARGLKRFTPKLKAVSEIGLPWKPVWRRLRDVGYQGTYRQFAAVASRLMGKPCRSTAKTKNLPAPTVERLPQLTAAPMNLAPTHAGLDDAMVSGEFLSAIARQVQVCSRPVGKN